MTRLESARLLLIALCLTQACDRNTLLARSHSQPSEAGADAGHEDGGIPTDGGFSISDAGVAMCGKLVCACSNGKDDDKDGLTDGLDGECTGAFDNDEASFGTGRERNPNARCLNCFFDDNPGAGNDGCRIAASCAVNGVAQGAPGSCNTCEPTLECTDRCLSRTPNGCDCFGCCGVHLDDGSVVNVMLSAECMIKGSKLSGCQSCVQNESCLNRCGTCELCPGKTESELPAECRNQGGVTCEGGPVCSTNTPCDLGQYCGLGCCLDVL
ncbi:MAG: hypothetical protein QM778_34270 [Myxococcales bacterium]